MSTDVDSIFQYVIFQTLCSAGCVLDRAQTKKYPRLTCSCGTLVNKAALGRHLFTEEKSIYCLSQQLGRRVVVLLSSVYQCVLIRPLSIANANTDAAESGGRTNIRSAHN
ncbi:hypothetical protein J6590_037445, partial [Homalodisca vitripennis]